MNRCLSLLALITCFAISVTAHASDLTFNITNGTFAQTGTFSGSFVIDSTTEDIISGSIFASAPAVNGASHTFSGTNTGSTPGEEIFNNGGGELFVLALNGGIGNLAINTLASSGSSDTALIAGGTRFDATGGTITAATTTTATPEPSSLLLLGTGALGLAASFRRRLLRA